MTIRRFPHTPSLTATLVLASLAATAQAGERHFAFVREVPVHQPGEIEYEQYITWKTHKESDSTFDEVAFRHELEIGLVQNFQLGFYLSDWRYRDGRSVERDGVDWQGLAVEAIYQFSDPTTDLLGVSVYQELKLGPERFVIEPKLLLQKNVSNWVFAYNFVFEAEWEGPDLGDLHEKKAEIKNILGISCLLTPNWSVGGELLHEIEWEDYAEWSDSAVYLGPNVTYRQTGWYVTVTPLVQVTDDAGASDFETRVVIGIDF